MLRTSYNPKAYLSQKRNVKLGLIARSRILGVIERKAASIREVRELTGLKYAVVLYHVRLLEKEKVVSRKTGKRPCLWGMTGAGQKRLAES